MSEANTIYDLDGRIIATAKLGVVWLREPRTRLGEYDYGESGQIWDNHRAVVATFSADGTVLRADGSRLGRIFGRDLFIGEEKVGECIGYPGACAAALVFVFSSSDHDP